MKLEMSPQEAKEKVAEHQNNVSSESLCRIGFFDNEYGSFYQPEFQMGSSRWEVMLSCLNLGRIVLNAYRHPIQSLTTWYNNFALSIWGGEVKNFVLKSVSYTLLVCLLVLIGCSQEQKIQGLIQDLGRKTPIFKGATPRSRAIRELRKIGEKAVPALIQALEDNNPEVCTGVALALGGIGEKAGPSLIQALQNPSVKSLVADTFVLIGKEALPDLIQTLRDKKSEFRASAAEVLGRIGSEDPETIMALWKVENTTQEFLKSNRKAFGRANPTEAAKALADTVPALIRALQDVDPTVRANAANALIRIGTPEAIESVLPVLRQALQNEDPAVRANVANALIQIGTPEAIESVLTVLKQALQNEDSAVRANVAKLLEKIGTPEALKILKANTPDQP